jgi:8-oxo-dGTP diphosphatase
VSQPSPPTVIAVAVVLSAGRVLVGRRRDDAADAPGRDEFPGGKVEVGEAVERAVARECFEESGVDVSVGRKLHVARTSSSLGPIEIHFHRAAPVDANIAPVPPFIWLKIEDLTRCHFPPANAEVIRLLLAVRGKNHP